MAGNLVVSPWCYAVGGGGGIVVGGEEATPNKRVARVLDAVLTGMAGVRGLLTPTVRGLPSDRVLSSGNIHLLAGVSSEALLEHHGSNSLPFRHSGKGVCCHHSSILHTVLLRGRRRSGGGEL